jgi:RNA polymerase sigma-70 factor, ECF subfamily
MTTLNFNHELISLQTKLSQYAYRLTANKDEAKDLLQETLLKALVYETKFEQYTNLKSWTYTIMKNIFINSYHRAIRQNTAFDNTVDLYYLNQSKDTVNETPETSYAAQELNHIIDTPFRRI